MGDISKGRTFVAGNIVVAADADEGVNKQSLNDLADDATINPDFIFAKPEDTTPDANNDFVVTYDASAGALKKVKLKNLPGGGLVASPSYSLIATSATPAFTCDPNKISQNFFFVMPTASDAALTITGAVNGMQGILLVAMGASIVRALSLPAGSFIPGNATAGTGPADLQPIVNRVTACSWIYNGTNFFWSFIKY